MSSSEFSVQMNRALAVGNLLSSAKRLVNVLEGPDEPTDAEIIAAIRDTEQAIAVLEGGAYVVLEDDGEIEP